MLQVLVDADNLHRARLAALLRALPSDATIIAAGAPRVLERVAWPTGTRLLPRSGWQRADLELAGAYRVDDGPLILATGDGDFAHLGGRHPGHVLVISSSPAAQLRQVGSVLDPVHDGADAIRHWLAGASGASEQAGSG